MNKTIDIRKITLMGMGIALNIVGGFIALQLQLPIYLDTIGTILIACLFGPIYGVLTGVGSNIIAGITTDPISLYFMPVQIIIGCLVGIVYKRGLLKGIKTPLGVFLFSVPASFAGASIAASIFGGVTSAGSSRIAQFLHEVVGLPLVTSVFTVQVTTDYLDKYVVVLLVLGVMRVLPGAIKNIYQG